MRWLALLLLVLGSCIDFQEAEDHYCATHPGCADSGSPDAGH